MVFSADLTREGLLCQLGCILGKGEGPSFCVHVGTDYQFKVDVHRLEGTELSSVETKPSSVVRYFDSLRWR